MPINVRGLESSNQLPLVHTGSHCYGGGGARPSSQVLRDPGACGRWRRLLANVCTLPHECPLQKVAESQAPARLSTLAGCRGVGKEIWKRAGICSLIEPILLPGPQWVQLPMVSFGLDLIAAIPPVASDLWKRSAASKHLAAMLQCATWV